MRDFRLIIAISSALVVIVSSCAGKRTVGEYPADVQEPSYIRIQERDEGGWTVVSVSPFDGSRDTLIVDRPMSRLVVMSTSHIGFLEAIGRLDVVAGVSGVDYVYSSEGPLSEGSGSPDSTLRLAPPIASDGPLPLTSRGWLRSGHTRPSDRPREASSPSDSERSDPGSLRGTPLSPPPGVQGGGWRQPTSTIVDVGYDAVPDYEKIVSIRPDLVLTYSVSAAKPPFVSRLERLGIKTLTVNEHLESHPLARASYIRLFGALTGDMAVADSVLEAVKESYIAVADSIARDGLSPRKVLLNIPYNDQWFIPSKSSYLTALIHDAGGDVLGAEEGRATSSVMSLEKAYTLGKDADCWLNVGWCSTMSQLTGINPVFGEMSRNIRSNASERGFGDIDVVWNENRRVNSKGGNDIWQSGVARPDLILMDLAAILHPSGENHLFTYYKPLD